MRKQVSVADAKARFAEYVREAEAGEVVVITRHGRVVAGVVSADDLAVVSAHRQNRAKGSLLELRKQTGMAGLVKELDNAVAHRGEPRSVSEFE